jgi:predicted AlkP superfamily pyrophosphatase or phosphodiesterase
LQVIPYECEVEHKQTNVPESGGGRQQSSLATHLPLPLHYPDVKTSIRRTFRPLLLLAVFLAATLPGFASAYNARPKLVVIIIIDQFRGDYLERYREHFGPSGFRMFLDRGAVFTDCHYDYATTFTAPGHASLFTGTYINGHGIVANDWWDTTRKRMVSSVADESTTLLGAAGEGASPHNLMGSTLGDELKLATGGRSRIFAISLKDRSAVLPGGFGADGAYWIEPSSGAFITSTFYRKELPAWVAAFNSGNRAAKYWNLEWRDASGAVLRSTTRTVGADGRPDFYHVVGATPFANDYQFEFARELITQEKLGAGPATDLLAISLSANDLLGHAVGPDSPQMQAMAVAMDRQLSEFLSFLGRQVGLANVWIALSGDHGVAPSNATSRQFRIPALVMGIAESRQKVNAALAARLGIRGDVIRFIDWPVVFINDEPFANAKIGEADAEHAVGEALKDLGAVTYFTRAQLAADHVPNTEMGRRFQHSYSPLGGWYLLAQLPAFTLPSRTGTTHGSPYQYDTHVPLAFVGLPFRAGIYRTHAEPIDLAVTLASLLGINQPSNSTGRVLTEALVPQPLTRAPEAEASPR